MKPFVFSNLATSVDGKIATVKRTHFPLGTPYDRKRMQVLRKKSDAILMGASTLRSFKKPLKVFNQKKQPANLILSTNLKGVSPGWPFFQAPDVRRVLFLSEKISSSRLKAFQKTSEIVFLKKGSHAKQILSFLEKKGIKRLLVEGGGNLMWEFAPWIHEFHVTLTPWILGGKDAPTLVDGKGFSPQNSLPLKLKSCRKVGNELYLIYHRVGH